MYDLRGVLVSRDWREETLTPVFYISFDQLDTCDGVPLQDQCDRTDRPLWSSRSASLLPELLPKSGHIQPVVLVALFAYFLLSWNLSSQVSSRSLPHLLTDSVLPPRSSCPTSGCYVWSPTQRAANARYPQMLLLGMVR